MQLQLLNSVALTRHSIAIVRLPTLCALTDAAIFLTA
jgi:hypothetical protein